MNRKAQRRSSPPAGSSFALAQTRRQWCCLGRQAAGGREQITVGETVRAEGHRPAAPGNQQLRTNYCLGLADRRTLVINPQSERTSYSFDAIGRATLQRLSNIIRVSMAYDAADRLVRLANITSTGTTITSFRDTWDGAGNRLARTEADGTLVTWSYDSTYQLTRERRNGANSYDTTYTYDSAGNRLVKLDNAVRTTYTSDAANQLNKYVDNTGTTTFTYDASGSQRTEQIPSGGITTNTWDFENRLIKVALPTGVLNTFTYNGDGMRVERQDSSGTLKAIWDGEKILEETDQNNVVQVIYTQSGETYGDVVSQRRSGVSRYFLFDPLGSTSRLTDGSQNVTDSYLFKGFAESLLAAGPTTNPFQFVGREGYYLDTDLGWNSLRAREYGPSIGRFFSVDSLEFARRAYLYASNNPLVAIDPSGLAPWPGPKKWCWMWVCCGASAVSCTRPGRNNGMFPCHCFVRVTSTPNWDTGVVIDFHGWFAHVAGDPTTQVTAPRCCEIPGTVGSKHVPELICGTSDDENYTGQFNALDCTPLGRKRCQDVRDCLEGQMQAGLCAGRRRCYGECYFPNSNTVAYQLANACFARKTFPAMPPTGRLNCGGAPGWGLFGNSNPWGCRPPLHHILTPPPWSTMPPVANAHLIPKTIVASLSSTMLS